MRRKRELDLEALVRRLPAFALVLAVALFVAWWVVRVSTVNSLVGVRPKIAAAIAPSDPQVLAAAVDMDMRARLGLASPEARALAREEMLSAPLSENALLATGIARLVKHDNRRADALIGRALARNPRSRLARLFMLEVELRADDFAGAASDMTILSRLLPDVEKLFIPELARFARDPQTRSALRRTVRSDPQVFGRLLYHLAQKGDDPAIVLQLAGDSPPLPGPDEPDWRQALLTAMIARGEVAPAQALWHRISGAGTPDARNRVYDGSFQGLPGFPPFNWTFSSSDIGAAERERRGGLQVEYYGRTAGELASQLIVLPPGPYRITVRAEGDLSTAEHRILWRMQCVRTDTRIFELPLANITYAGRTIAGDFAVPKNCPAQWLKLVGEPTEFPKIENVLIRDVRIQPRAAAT